MQRLCEAQRLVGDTAPSRAVGHEHVGLEEGQAVGAPFPSAAYVREILSAANGRGHGEDDFGALIEVLEGLAGTRL